MTTIKAHFDGSAFIPDEPPIDVPVNQPLTLHVEEGPAPAHSITGRELAASALIGLWKDRSDIQDPQAFARRLRAAAETRNPAHP